MKHVGVLTIYKILFIYIYIYIYIYGERERERERERSYIFCAFVGLDNEQYKMHGTYVISFHKALNMLVTYPFRILS